MTTIPSTLPIQILSLCACLAATSGAHASDHNPDNFKIALGAYAVKRYESSLSLTDSSLGTGAAISPTDTLGLDFEQTVTRLSGYYRFTPEHALTYSWYRITSTGNRTIEDEFDWLGEDGQKITIPVGAQATSKLEYDIIKLGYIWSFYHNDKIEVSAGGGFHITRIGIDLSADTTVSSVSTSNEARDIRTNIPLPVLSFRLRYSVTPRFSWQIKSEVFAISYEDWSGTYTDSTLELEYRAWDNIAFGAGMGSNALRIKEDTDNYRFKYENRLSGFSLFAAAYF